MFFSSSKTIVVEQNAIKTKLSGLNVQIPDFEEKHQGKDTYIAYRVIVEKEGDSWTLYKRYSDFHFFFSNISSYCDSMANIFPPKQVGSMRQEQIEARRQQMNAFFLEFLAMPMNDVILSQTYNFFEVYEHSMGIDDGTSKRTKIKARIAPGQLIKAGYITKLGGNKDGRTGNWKRRYLVLQDDLKYYNDENSFKRGGAPKGIVKLNSFFVPTPEIGPTNPENQFSIHALPFSFVCRADSTQEMLSWVQILKMFRNISNT